MSTVDTLHFATDAIHAVHEWFIAIHCLYRKLTSSIDRSPVEMQLFSFKETCGHRLLRYDSIRKHNAKNTISVNTAFYDSLTPSSFNCDIFWTQILI